MIIASRGRNIEVRDIFDGIDRVPLPSSFGGTASHSGVRVSLENAAGIPAVLRAYRLVSETIAGFPVRVCRHEGGVHKVVEGAPQAPLLEQPSLAMDAFAFWSYALGCLLRGNLYLQKLRSRGRVVELRPIHPDRVRPKATKGGTVEYHVRNGGQVTILSRRDLLHVPGILLDDPYCGVSVISASRHGIGIALARQEFEGRFLANDATPPVVLKHPAHTLTKDQQDEFLTSFDRRNAGSQNAGRTALTWGGIEVEQLGISMQDAQFVETQRYTVQDVARMFGVPSGLLGDTEAPGADDPEKENKRFLQLGLKPWLDRLEYGLHADSDVFPDRALHPSFDFSALLRPDVRTRSEANHKARQAGWKTANEIRAEEGLPPHKDGDVLQVVPVGGGPERPGTTSSEQDSANDE